MTDLSVETKHVENVYARFSNATIQFQVGDVLHNYKVDKNTLSKFEYFCRLFEATSPEGDVYIIQDADIQTWFKDICDLFLYNKATFQITTPVELCNAVGYYHMVIKLMGPVSIAHGIIKDVIGCVKKDGPFRLTVPWIQSLNKFLDTVEQYDTENYCHVEEDTAKIIAERIHDRHTDLKTQKMVGAFGGPTPDIPGINKKIVSLFSFASKLKCCGLIMCILDSDVFQVPSSESRGRGRGRGGRR